jgi:DNA-binding NarL/FixJ family response regulator
MMEEVAMPTLRPHSTTGKRGRKAEPSSAKSTSAKSNSRSSMRVASKRSAQSALSKNDAPDDFTEWAARGGIRVLCVDDHAVLIEGLRAQFAIQDRIRIVGSLDSAATLLEETARLNPDVVLLDIEMPGPDVFEMADRLRHMHPRVRFIFLSAHIRDGYLAAAYKCGAWGYFAKGDDLQDIVKGVAEVARSSAAGGGTFVMGPKVATRLQPPQSRRPGDAPVRTRQRGPKANTGPATSLSSLTPREVAILRLIGKGLTRTQIAKELSRSPKTIDGHQERMMKKLSITSRADLMRFAIREGLAEA